MPRSSYDDGWHGYGLSRFRRITVAFSIDRAYNISMIGIVIALAFLAVYCTIAAMNAE